MDKISNILPSNARVQTVDPSNAPALRPGTPSFGMPVGTSAAADKVTLSKAATGPEMMMEGPENWKQKDQKQAAIAKSVSDNFFGRTPTGVAGEMRVSGGTTEQLAKQMNMQQAKEAVRPMAEARVQQFLSETENEIPAVAAQPVVKSYAPKGSQLNVLA